MPIHIKDMKTLPDPIKNEFKKQFHWVLSKTNNAFSSIPFDQAHEQENAYVKGSGGCIGLMENPVAFRRWMLSGQNWSGCKSNLKKNTSLMMTQRTPGYFQNHEQGLATQKAFQEESSCSLQKTSSQGNIQNR